MVRVRRALTDALLSIAGLSVLLGVLVAVNPGVRQQVSKQVTSGQAVTDLSAHVEDFAADVLRSTRHETIKYAPLVVFVAAACVLVVFMLRV